MLLYFSCRIIIRLVWSRLIRRSELKLLMARVIRGKDLKGMG